MLFLIVLLGCVYPVWLIEYKKLSECCDDNKLVVQLDTDGQVYGTLPGNVKLELKDSDTYSDKECSKQAFLEIDFQPTDTSRCVDHPMCGQRMLRIDFSLRQPIQDWTFHLGTDKDVNGWGGDECSGCPEVQGRGDTVVQYPSRLGDKFNDCEGNLIESKMLNANVTRVSVFVAHEYVRVENDIGQVAKSCSKCGLDLAGITIDQDGNKKTHPSRLYLALNRVIAEHNIGRTGYGLCQATLSWVCY